MTDFGRRPATTLHASRHEDGGLDEISVASLSGQLADAQPFAAHDLAGTKHDADTLADLNLKISDATLDDSGDARPLIAHHVFHEDAGGDTIDLPSLSGVCSDEQNAGFIKGVTVDDTAKADGKALTYKSGSGEIEYVTPAGGGPANAIIGDGTPGRILRASRLKIDNGSAGSTLKVTFDSTWNGDTIGETDNVAKNATTGNFTLDSNGWVLLIEASGLSGNVVHAWGFLTGNYTTIVLTLLITHLSNDIKIVAYDAATAALKDLTALVDTGVMYIEISYLTDE